METMGIHRKNDSRKLRGKGRYRRQTKEQSQKGSCYPLKLPTTIRERVASEKGWDGSHLLLFEAFKRAEVDRVKQAELTFFACKKEV